MTASTWGLGLRHAGFALAIAVVGLFGGDSARAAEPRVPQDFYGVNLTTSGLSDPVRERNLSGIEQLGITEVRYSLPWYDLEPAPPAGAHTYHWGRFDEQIAAMARHGIRAQPIIGLTPKWAAESPWVAESCAFNYQPSARPYDLGTFRDMAGAVAARYGRGGTFWEQNPSLPARPVVAYEVWNEPSIAPYWCPAPQPEIYGSVFHAAAQEIRAVDPAAELIVGGLLDTRNYPDPQLSIQPKDFLRRMTGAVPATLNEISAVGVHAFMLMPIEQQLAYMAFFRDQLRAGGIPDSIPMQINEFGWTTRGQWGFPEQQRAERFRRFATEAMRTNCNIDGIHALTWVSLEQQEGEGDQWFGIVNATTGNPYPSGQAYSQSMKLMRGELSSEPPRETFYICDGMPAPDQDSDGVRDELDDFPLDPTQTGDQEPPVEEPPVEEPPAEEPPSGGSGGGGQQDLITWLLNQLFGG